jgi:hypothetical protein
VFLLKAFAVWLVLIGIETIHGVFRTLFLAPYVGDLRARQVAVFTGSLLILMVTCLFVRWLQADDPRALLCVGLIWFVLTLLFEVSLGRYVLGLSWEAVASDYDISRGGLLPFGLVFLTLAPLIAARFRLKQGKHNLDRKPG